MTYDLILRGGRVIDPSQKLDAVADEDDVPVAPDTEDGGAVEHAWGFNREDRSVATEPDRRSISGPGVRAIVRVLQPLEAHVRVTLGRGQAGVT